MFKWLKNLFAEPETKKEIKLTTLEDIDIFDTVWIKDKDEILEGWIYDKTKKRLVVVSNLNEYIFHYTRPLNKTEITFNGKILYFNNPC